MLQIPTTDLLINPDGSIYHLSLKPEHLADTVILVGDPDRVPEISWYFDKVEYVNRNREFICHTGKFRNRRITALSTGIGTDNIDIVLQELDALVNVDFSRREINPVHKTLDIIRLGTSGAIQPDIPVNSLGLSTYGMGLDNLLYFYNDNSISDIEMSDVFMEKSGWNIPNVRPYFIKGSEGLAKKFTEGVIRGITVTAPGFYGPQGRKLRINLADPAMITRLQRFRFNGERIINFEMETSALYALGTLLDHNVLTVCALIANRATQSFCIDHKPVIKRLIELVLETICQ
jgi:uridine phosphorylase